MELLKNLNTRKARVLLALGIGAGALTGCANYSGDGNEFSVVAQVTDVGKQSIEADVMQINYANGDADGWFDDMDIHRFHDNCDCHGFWNGRKTYGTVLEAGGIEITLAQLPEEICIAIEGKIRSNSEGKTYSDRPVFDTAQIVPCG